MYGRGSGSSSGYWQAAVGTWAASQWRGAEGAAPVMRERAIDVVVEVQTCSGSTGLSRLHTSRYLDDPGYPPILFDYLHDIVLYVVGIWCRLSLLVLETWKEMDHAASRAPS